MKSTTVIFIESPRYMASAEYLNDINNTQFLTNSKECFLELSSKSLNPILLKTRSLYDCIIFKKNFRKINPLNVILFNDHSPVSFWIQKNFYTILINVDLPFALLDLFTVRFQKNQFIKPNPFFVRLFQLISQPKVKIENKFYYFKNASIMRAYLFLIQKIIFGFDYVFNTLPGRHASVIAINNENVKNTYIKSGFSKEKLHVTGSIEFDATNEQIKKTNSLNLKKSVDIIFLTQPYYLYPSSYESWSFDIESFVDDCQENNLSYLLLLHPRENRNYYEKFTNNENILSFEQRTPQQDFELIKSSKLVVLKASTSSIIPFNLKKPICYINYSSMCPDQNAMSFFHHDMILYQNNNIGSVLKKLKTNKINIAKFQNFKIEENYPYQSQTLSKIVELLK